MKNRSNPNDAPPPQQQRQPPPPSPNNQPTNNTNDNTTTKKHAVVMVLGDIGRSPRMQYHALSLLEEGHYVTLIGYDGEALIPMLECAIMLPQRDDDDDDDDGAPSPATATASRRENKKPSYYGNIHVLRMSPYQPPKTTLLQRLLYYFLRLASLFHCVIYTLWVRLNSVVTHTSRPVDVLLVQNPPSVPTLLLAYLYCVWQGTRSSTRPRLVIDWHNLGYTMFEDESPPESNNAMMKKSIRKLAQIYEWKMAPLADAHLTVTHAMEHWLGENFNVHGERVKVLYDKPPVMFRPTSLEEMHELFTRLDLEDDGKLLNARSKTLSSSSSSSSGMQREEREEGAVAAAAAASQIAEETIFTRAIRYADGSTSVRPRDDRPALLVSSTSWTPDEDFSILLDALRVLHDKIATTSSTATTTATATTVADKYFPKVLVIVTGKGPQKDYYIPLLKKFNETHHPYINIQTLWLEAGDYPTLLGCATLGVSLHTSTSGLDLPMKVLDMFGCQVPVCAIGFDCLDELVKDGVNGRVFEDAGGLADDLFDLLKGYPGEEEAMGRLEMYRRNIRGMTRWKENWEECARHLIVGDWDDRR